MAPKRHRVVGSSSAQPDFDEGFDENRFVSSLGQVEYNRLRNKSVAKERGFKPSANDGELLAMINERGWRRICDTPLEVPLGIVREFYANAKEATNGYSWVRGITVDYRMEAIANFLRLPANPRGAEDWATKSRNSVDLEAIVLELCVPGTVWKVKPGTTEQSSFPASALNRYARAWNLFICARLMPSSHSHDITVDRAILLYGILTGQFINLGVVLYFSMTRYMNTRTSGAIPHASLITQLCVAAGVRWDAVEQIQQQSADIDSAAIARLEEWPGGIPHPRGLGYILGEAVDPVPPPRRFRAARSGRVAARQSVDQGPSDSQYRRLLRRMDTMFDINRRFAQDMTISLDRVLARDGLQADWPVYGAHHPYPPPDSPPGSPPEEDDDDQ